MQEEGSVNITIVLFRSIEIIAPLNIFLNVPLGLGEMILAGWLIIKGFGGQPVSSPTEELKPFNGK
jgi:hypothetical protein